MFKVFGMPLVEVSVNTITSTRVRYTSTALANSCLIAHIPKMNMVLHRMRMSANDNNRKSAIEI